MQETMARVIHPGWITKMFENEQTGEWAIYHQCATCGYVLDGSGGTNLFGVNPFVQHKRKKHPNELFNLEIYLLRAAINARHLYYGLKAFEWPS